MVFVSGAGAEAPWGKGITELTSKNHHSTVRRKIAHSNNCTLSKKFMSLGRNLKEKQDIYRNISNFNIISYAIQNISQLPKSSLKVRVDSGGWCSGPLRDTIWGCLVSSHKMKCMINDLNRVWLLTNWVSLIHMLGTGWALNVEFSFLFCFLFLL